MNGYGKDIDDLTNKLRTKYPDEANYSSKSTLYRRAFDDGVITKDEIEAARILWTLMALYWRLSRNKNQ